MKITYQFISGLKNILFAQGDSWKSAMSEEACKLAPKIDMLREKLAQAREEAKEKSTPKLEKQIENLEAQIPGMLQRLEDLRNNTQYAWNVAPFKDIEDAKLLLANIHILENAALQPFYNKEALAAVKSMLAEKFSTLYDGDVEEIVSGRFIDCNQTIKPETVKSILAGKIPTIEEIKIPIFEDERAKDIVLRLEKLLVQLDPKIFAEITKSMILISKFYSLNDDILLNLMIPAVLSVFFENITDFEEFLSKHVDYSTVNSLENSFVQIQTLPNEICDISHAQKAIWSKIVAHGGKQAMIKFLSKQSDSSFSIEGAYKESGENIATLWETLSRDFSSDKLIYSNVTGDTENLAEICVKYNITEEVFDRIATEILPRVKDHDDLPDVSFDIEFKGQTFHFFKLSAGDLRGLFLGHDTGCCQYIGGDAEKAVEDAFTRTDAGFYVLTDNAGKIKAQSLAWSGEREIKSDAESVTKTVLVLDSFEHNKDVASIYIPLMKALKNHIGEMELYVGTGGQTPKTSANGYSDVKPPEGFNRYGDSLHTYHITDSVKLREKQIINPKEYNGLDEYIESNFSIAFNKFYQEYPEVAKSLNFNFSWCNEIKTIELLRSSPKLRDFMVNKMQYDEVNQKPLEGSMRESLMKIWTIWSNGGIEYTFFHKFKILEALLDQGYDDDKIVEIFQGYYTNYDFDPALLEKIGYENVTKLPYSIPGGIRLSLSTVINLIRGLKSKDDAEAKLALEEILQSLNGEPKDLEKIALDIVVQSIPCLDFIVEEKKKALVSECYIKFGDDVGWRLRGFLENTHELLLNSLSASELMELYVKREDFEYWKYTKDLAKNIPAEFIVEFVQAAIKQKLVLEMTDMSYSWNIAMALKCMPASEVIAVWDRDLRVLKIPNHISQIEYSKSPYIKSLDNEGLRKLATLLSDLGDNLWRVMSALEKYDAQTISDLGIENIIKLSKVDPFCGEGWDLAKLKQELDDLEIPEELTIASGEHYHKIHLAKHLTIPAGAKFETDFPIEGFYEQAPNLSFSTSHHANSSGESYMTYIVTNTGENPIVLDHI